MFEPTTLMMIVGSLVAMTAVWGALRPMANTDPFCV